MFHRHNFSQNLYQQCNGYRPEVGPDEQGSMRELGGNEYGKYHIEKYMFHQHKRLLKIYIKSISTLDNYDFIEHFTLLFHVSYSS